MLNRERGHMSMTRRHADRGGIATVDWAEDPGGTPCEAGKLNVSDRRAAVVKNVSRVCRSVRYVNATKTKSMCVLVVDAECT